MFTRPGRRPAGNDDGRRMQARMSGEKQKPGRFSLLVRITAGMLAVIMILSVVLYNSSGVTMDTDSYVEKDTRLAARELMKDNTYAGNSRVGQMMTFARSVLTGNRTLSDVEEKFEIAVSQKRYDDAINLTEQAISLYPDEDETKGRLYLRMGYLYVLKDDAQAAAGWLDKGIALAPSPEAYLTRAQVELDLGDAEAALRDAEVYMQTAENPDELLADLVNIYEATGEYETAAGMYTKLISGENGGEYLLNRAYCLTRLGRLEEAAEDRERYGAAGGTELASADVMIGLGWMQTKDYAQAGDSFIKALGENYADPESLYFYVVLCSYMTENYQRVCDYGDQLIALVQNGGKTVTAEIGVEKMTGRLNISLVKMDLAALYQMNGASHLATGNYETAESRLTACLAEKPDDAYASYLRGVSRLALGRFSEAAADFDTSVAADVETERSRYSRAICRMQTGDTEGAADDLDWVLLHGTDKDLFETASALQTQLIAGDSPVINE